MSLAKNGPGFYGTLALCLFSGFGGSALYGAAQGKSMVVALPLLAHGREARGGVEWNAGSGFGMALEYCRLFDGEDLRDTEIEKNSKHSLKSDGKEIKFSLAQYSDMALMSGLYWTAGIGYREIDVNWTKGQSLGEGVALADDQLNYHEVTAFGPTAEVRGGYRFVGQNIGFMAGIYLAVRHFQANVRDREVEEDLLAIGPVPSKIDDDAKGQMQRRLMTTVIPRIELGWAF